MGENGNGDDKGKLIDRIKKLLALADSPNEHEAALAADMAAKLMQKYQFNESDLRVQVADKLGMVRESTPSLSGNGKFERWEGILVSDIAKIFGAKALQVPGGGRYTVGGKQEATTTNEYWIFGYPKDVDMTLYFFRFLRRTVAKKGSEVKGITARNSYTMGMVTKLHERLSEMFKKVEQSLSKDCTDLVVVKKKNVADFIADQVGKTHNVNNSIRKFSYASYQKGLTDGQKVSINRPLSGQEQRRIR